MKRIIIVGATSQDNGAESGKLASTTVGIQKNACADSAGMLRTVTSPTPKTTALTITNISAATLARARVLSVIADYLSVM
jgi:hypothetical protein